MNQTESLKPECWPTALEFEFSMTPLGHHLVRLEDDQLRFEEPKRPLQAGRCCYTLPLRRQPAARLVRLLRPVTQ